MENFIVSARKYRPDTFDTVVGQLSITSTLRNAIKNNHLAHAYLFCGPRGVGKTTCARIFAKTINCFNLSDDVEACNECESCKGFNSSRSYNIHELDAASNNSVEDIRNLIDQVRIPPQVGKHSVYIIDEVHMLSTAAFNAFLKTLEEPPSHATFILATTEKHKILPTILSRCQIFDFNRIGVEDAAKHLAYIAEKEGVVADMDALNVIGQKADGAMRDALSLFDQIVSFSGEKITYQDAIDNLNVLDYDYYFKLTDAFLTENITDTLLIFNKILNKGFDGHHFISGLSSHFRDLMVCKDPQTVELLEVGATIKENYKNQAQKCDKDFLYKALDISNTCDLNYKISTNQRLLVELALIKICNILTEKKKSEQLAKEAKEKKQEQGEQKGEAKKEEQKPQIKERPKMPSIMASLNGNSEEKEEEKTEVKVELNEKFTQEQLLKAWNDLSDSIKTDKPRLGNLLISQKPIIKDETNIEIPLVTKIQEELIDEERVLIGEFLIKELKNSKIRLSPVVQEQKKVKRKVFTVSDRFDYLKSKNPLVAELKERFKLDF